MISTINWQMSRAILLALNGFFRCTLVMVGYGLRYEQQRMAVSEAHQTFPHNHYSQLVAWIQRQFSLRATPDPLYAIFATSRKL